VTQSVPRSATSPNLLVFDGDCGLCTSWVEALERVLPRFPRSIPSQWADLDSLGLTQHDVTNYAWFVTPTHQYAGHLAFSALLRSQPSAPLRFVGHLLATPPITWIAAAGYRLIALNRHRLPGGTPACRMPRPDGD
jgi:predicted DCC family thiol-disulfide oxidoreductase YuxK